jgi:hypothetical protein
MTAIFYMSSVLAIFAGLGGLADLIGYFVKWRW